MYERGINFLDKQIIIYYLQNKELDIKLWQDAKAIREKMLNLQIEREKLKTEITYSAQVSVHISDTLKSQTHQMTDLGDAWDKADKQMNSYEKELMYAYNRILTQIDEFKRIQLIFSTLLPREREIITLLYIENQTWEAVEIETGINHRILVRDVNKIFHDISDKYESNISNNELARQKNTYRLIKPQKNKKSVLNRNCAIEEKSDPYDFFIKVQLEEEQIKGNQK